ncbi:HAD family phosphatase [Vibrio sp. SS-MA-C1-2]|uniref:HAD family hydrolase n=1 Tax=Vibrio sp. SS-MA-C1-2 TaxID=2908646 RepID=UPI001F15CDFF|nr:HAD family phosphatase [Vibrio sp. SS-MA-C1-2]UJF18360.1 HAD family phosphatase [Vibrio sp. SS-MA-C1-2]
MKKFKVILFDLGGVLIELGENLFPTSWHNEGNSFQLADYFHSPLAMKFERGLISEQEFAQGMNKALTLNATVEETLAAFRAWPKGFYSGAPELLNELKRNFQLVVLTNTNETHWPRLIDEFKLKDYSKAIFASHLMHKAKPDINVFQYVLSQVDVLPEDILFFDDNLSNVEAAKSLGIYAVQVNGIDELKVSLQGLKLIKN